VGSLVEGDTIGGMDIVEIRGVRLDWTRDSRRDLPKGRFVQATRGWFKWHVDVRYHSGRFAPLIRRTSYWRRADAQQDFDTAT